ncbi:MAG TPA: NAD(P)-dependent oxidoreductase [Candidatus Hydrogenedentes bacterium]|nr:NAD(P)-dependent oxidoreductase [Candidatus Hydrogenedentota bacterium]
MTIMVTGSSGLIGEAIACYLDQAGHAIVGISRRKSSTLPERILQIEADITSPLFIDTILREAPPCDVIVHAAADRNSDPFATSATATNCLGTQQVLAVAHAWPATAFLFLSGVAVIGIPKEIPITEEHPAHPLSAYLAAKLYGEHLVNATRRSKVPDAIFRISAPIGAHMPRERILSVFIERALTGHVITINGTGARRQDYVDVRDIAQAVENWIAHPVKGLFNIASGHAISNLDLAKRCISLVQSSSRVEFTGKPDPADTQAWEVAIEKAKRAFNYQPAYTLEKSILHIAEALKTHS